MSVAVWRLRPLAVPPWEAPCAQCGAASLESTGRFRVNSNGALHDVWLIYRCARCSARRNRAIHRRVREGPAGVTLAPYRADDPALAEVHAFALSPGVAVPYTVQRTPLALDGRLRAVIEQPLFCGARWDRLLARELGRSRAEVQRAWAAGRIRVEPAARPRQPVRDGQRLHAEL